MKITLIPRRARSARPVSHGGLAAAPVQRFVAAFDLLFPLCFVPETRPDGAVLSADLLSSPEQVTH